MVRNKLLLVLLLLVSLNSKAQEENAFKSGEWFKFRIHYGVFTASYATLSVNETTLNNKPVFHVKGRGKSTGLLSLFFKVDDDYQSYFDRYSGDPYKFIRKIDEGGYTKDIEIDFNQETKKALVFDKKRNKKSTHDFKVNTQDMISAFYYLRNKVDTKKLVPGQEININMFFDKENFGFKLKFLGRENLKTKFGKVPSLKFRPLVQSGRVFEEEESLTVWVSDDQNKMPLRIQAKLAVGSLKADIDAYKGLKYPFKLIFD